MGYIYKITNTVNNKSYIGYTTDPQERWEGHKHNQGSALVFQAIKKYGLDKIEFKVIAEDSVDNEQKYIEKYNTIAPNGYNLTEGGNVPPRPWGSYLEMYGNNEKAKKFSNKQKQAGGYGPVAHTKATKKKLSIANQGKGNPMYGKKHSKKTLRLISESKKGLHHGAGNPNAKRFLLISPEGVKYQSDGNLRQLCASLNLSHATIRASYELNRPMRSGWRVERL